MKNFYLFIGVCNRQKSFLSDDEHFLATRRCTKYVSSILYLKISSSNKRFIMIDLMTQSILIVDWGDRNGYRWGVDVRILFKIGPALSRESEGLAPVESPLLYFYKINRRLSQAFFSFPFIDNCFPFHWFRPFKRAADKWFTFWWRSVWAV